MLKTLSLAGAALAMTATALVPITPAVAQSRYYGERGYDRGYDRGYRSDRGYRNERVYRGDRGYYNDRNYRARQKCNDGDGGTIVGAIAGGLLGRTIDTRGDRLLGTVLGAGAGALAGRAIDRSDRPGYCRR
ncbi:glycine zipper 2TM domain-containing protein [Sphingomonadaceae bacterium OTU29MARTA1]|uniref:glycine zipper 2TM domain-containing protein n=1 Tax=Sphingomonas sp. Leaf37 TaxID=2876552 RepID=UPI001E48B3DB|nr:glycine zipper 2TM domain-containing protein [Sphingomonas sp. Leaf37]USU07785.1 glycine zipper 2TM domain-containing protein [Sphingomonadaceae bacterium OTU29MARTA1]USU11372.1 glycine zipper 2TM domain-containing protein [Sphingomonadaceae bacterium OTU29THOMA1]